MSTKLDAEGLAERRSNALSAEIHAALPKPVNEPTGTIVGKRVYDWKSGYAAAIREHSQPLADELAQVKAERDELREALNEMLGADPESRLATLAAAQYARTILAKYPKP